MGSNMFWKLLVGVVMVIAAVVQPAQSQMVFMVPNIPKVPPPEIGKTENIKTVAVLSAIGATMTLKNVHRFSLTSPITKQLDIAEFKIDDQAEATVRQLLGSRF